MKKILITSLLSALILVHGMTSTGWADPRGYAPSWGHRAYAGGQNHGYGGHRGFSAGTLLAGVIIGSVLNEILSPPAQAVYQPAACAPQVAYVQPRVVYSPPACYPPVVRYVQQPVVVRQTPYIPPADTVWIQNSNGSRTPVELRRAEGGMYIGPKGEYYWGLPNDDQLRSLYGM